MDLSGRGIGVKYSVGKMSEIMISCNEMIFKLQQKVSDVSRDVETMGETPVVCTSSSTCLGDRLRSAPVRKGFDRTMGLPTLPEPKSIRNPHLRQLYEKITDLENVGRRESLKTFTYISNYMRILRQVARKEFDTPKKFIQRQTLVLNGPYTGLRNDLIVSNKEQPSENQFEKSQVDFAVKHSRITVKNLKLEGLKDEGLPFTPKSIPGFRCSCLGIVSYPPRMSDARTRGQKYAMKLNYCIE